MLQPKKNNQEKDITFPNPPTDSISSLSVNGNASTPTTMLIAGSWDKTLSMYEIKYDQSGNVNNIIRHNQLQHEGPVLCSEVGPDNMTTFSAGTDGAIKMWNASQPVTSVQTIGKHDQAVSAMKFLPESNILVTTSWDKSIRLWDCRSPNPAAVLPTSERIYAMDAKGQYIVAGTADKHVHIYQLQNKMADYKSSLAYQTRCISIFTNLEGYAIGCIEGRVGIEYFHEVPIKIQAQQQPNFKTGELKSFAFKCHRDTKDIYAINSIDFNKYNTFCTAGGEGLFTFWDHVARARLSNFEAHQKRCPINTVKFNPMGTQLFYSLSYDWSKGIEGNNATMGVMICMHPVLDSEIQPKPKTNK